MKITDIAKMREIVYQMKTDDATYRAGNRAAINHEFNGGAPYTEQEAVENGIFCNVQPLMAPRLAHDARRQLDRGRSATGTYFNLNIDIGTPEQTAVVSKTVARAINKQLRENPRFTELLRGMDANVVLHGKAPVLWNDDQDPLPVCLAIEDIKLPTDTYCDFSNLSHFCCYMPLSAAELVAAIDRKKVNPGWNVSYVWKVVKSLTKDVIETSESDEDFPEKAKEDMKQNGTYYASDRVPTAKCWAFYQLATEGKKSHWEMSIFEDPTTSGIGDPYREMAQSKGEFLFEQKGGYSKDIFNIVHCQYADGSNVPPFKYHSVRGLGYFLYPILRLHDRYFCRVMDAFFEACNQLFRNVGEEDRERLQHIVLANFSVLPQGVQYVPANERYTVNHNIVRAGMDMMRQYVQENSSSFTQETDTGTRKEMTATEAMARVQQATALMGSMLSMQGVYRQHFFAEVCRRYCIANNRNDKVREFRTDMRKLGIPDEAFDFKRWDVLVENAVGGGNKTLEMAQTNELMAARSAFPPKVQQDISKKFLLARYDNPQTVDKLMPEEPQPPTRTEVFATLAIGTLLQGLPVALDPGLNMDEYAGALMTLLGQRIQQVAQTGVTPSIETVLGMQNTIMHVGQVIQQLAQDETKRQAMGGAMQMLKQMEKQVQQWLAAIQQQQGQAQLSPEAQSKIVSSQILAQSKAKIDEERAQQRLAHREAAHQQKMAESQVELQADLEAKDLMTANDLRSQTMKDLAKAKAQQRGNETK